MQTKLLKELTDFTQLRRKHEDFNTANSKLSGQSLGPEIDVENNEMILKSFRELRDKVRNSQKENQNLREEMKSMQIQIVQLHQSENNLMAINHQLKQKNIQVLSATDQLKKKNALLKQQLSQKVELEQQLQYMKTHTVDLQLKVDKLQEQKKKLIEISIEDKLDLQQKINKLIFKGNSDQQYICQIEDQHSRAKENIIKLENQLKRIQIKYDQEVFNKQWSKDNFIQEKYQAYVKELELQVSQGKNRLRKEKEKRGEIQKRVLQLEQVAGLWNVKAQTYEGQVGVMSKKVKKMERRMSQAKNTVNKLSHQKINWEERFFKTVFIAQQLINRVKRQLMGDTVELAKSCEYRINKIKQGKQIQVFASSNKKDTVGISNKKITKSDRKERRSHEKYQANPVKILTQSSSKLNFEAKGVLTQSQSNIKAEAKTKLNVDLFRPEPLNDGNEQNQNSIEQACNSMQMKIRRQRQEMEKKLRQRMLYRKIQTCSTPNKSKLRQDYLKQILEK